MYKIQTNEHQNIFWMKNKKCCTKHTNVQWLETFISSDRRGHDLFLCHDPVLFLFLRGQQLQDRQGNELYISINGWIIVSRKYWSLSISRVCPQCTYNFSRLLKLHRITHFYGENASTNSGEDRMRCRGRSTWSKLPTAWYFFILSFKLMH